MTAPVDASRVLVVAATEHELFTGDTWDGLLCGVGPVEAAAATAGALARYRPAAVLHVGIAGARRAANLTPGTVVIGREAVYCDLAPSTTWCPRVLAPDAALVSAVGRAVPEGVAMTIGSSARVGGTTGCDVEAMEGFAVLRAAQLAAVPAVEVRVISNEIEEADRARWRLAEAFGAIGNITPRLVAAVAAAVLRA